MTEVRFLDINDDGQPELWLDYGYGYARWRSIYNGWQHDGQRFTCHMERPIQSLAAICCIQPVDIWVDIMTRFIRLKTESSLQLPKGSYGETEDQQTDENGELIYRYYWNGEDVSEEQYEQNLKRTFDQDQAEDIYQNIYTFEQSKALLQQMM